MIGGTEKHIMPSTKLRTHLHSQYSAPLISVYIKGYICHMHVVKHAKKKVEDIGKNRHTVDWNWT